MNSKSQIYTITKLSATLKSEIIDHINKYNYIKVFGDMIREASICSTSARFIDIPICETKFDANYLHHEHAILNTIFDERVTQNGIKDTKYSIAINYWLCSDKLSDHSMTSLFVSAI